MQPMRRVCNGIGKNRHLRFRPEGARLQAQRCGRQKLHACRRARAKGTLVVFVCNHCPYVKASIDRIVAEAQVLRDIGIGTIAIMPNDTATYREDSFDNMKAFATKHGFTFPYVIDETQEVARAYDAQCTPDFFGFNAQDELQYRGRLDASSRPVRGNEANR